MKRTLFIEKVKAFPEFNSNTDISFILFDFHKYFDGIIGLNELRRFNFSINLVNKQLKNNQLNILILKLLKHVKRLDKAIGAIMRFVKDKLFERLIVLHKGKLCTKLGTLRNRHKKK